MACVGCVINLGLRSRDGFEQKLMKPSRAEPSAPWFRAEPSPFKGIESSRAETEPSQSKAIFCTESAFSLFDRKKVRIFSRHVLKFV